jgi:small neutral amino acid transporter SnatA (MarC family)
MLRAACISAGVFIVFAAVGDAVFTDVLQVRFAAFLIFGGLIFLIVAYRFVFQGPAAVELLRGPSGHVAGAIAMPFMIGPGTINASVLAGSRNDLPAAAIAIGSAVLITAVTVVVLKALHDFASRRHAMLVERYVDLCGRLSALVIGTIAVEMIFQGIEGWLKSSELLAAG